MSRRKFSREFKISAVKLVNEHGYSIPDAAKSLGIDQGSVRYWISKFSREAGMAPSGEGALKPELQRLRKENARLMNQRNIRARIKRQYVPRTTDSHHQEPVARNVLDRRFNAKKTNRKWVADITYVAPHPATPVAPRFSVRERAFRRTGDPARCLPRIEIETLPIPIHPMW